MENFVVTSYINPDMDGISSMYAYSEYLRKTGKNAHYYYAGKMKKEVLIVSNKYGIDIEGIDKIAKEDKIILVDTNHFQYLPSSIEPQNIVQIYDHHRRNDWLNDRSDIDIHIEEIGAAATLIAEKFWKDHIDISKESAILLYFGIISNTMNLKIKMTTSKDKNMAQWLKEQAGIISDSDVRQVFLAKSEIGDDLRADMEIENVDAFMNISWTIGQLEIANVESFLKVHEKDIRNILDIIYEEKKVQYISVNCMDIINGYNIIVVRNQETADLIAKNLEIEFSHLKGKTKELISRKEIIRIMRQRYNK